METRVVFTGKQEASLEPFEPGRPGPGQVLVRTRKTLISTGTECIVFNRLFEPGTGWEAWVRYPFYPGYCLVGEIADVGEGVEGWKTGDRVAARRGHASAHVLRAGDCVPVPDGLKDEEAVWFALAKIAAMGARCAEYRLGAAVAIIGAGPIGQMSVRWAAAAGAEPVIVIDSVPRRLEWAADGGATATVAGNLDAAAAGAIAANGGRKPEIVVDTTGNAAVFAGALRLAADRGTVVILGDTGTPSEQRLAHDLVTRGLRVVGAHDTHDSPDWNLRSISRLFFRLARAGRFRLAGLNTHIFPPAEARRAYELATSRRAETMGILFDWTAA